MVWGDYGLRLRDTHRRISAKHLLLAYETIKKRLRGERYRLFTRVAANIGVYTSGNEVRMGKGKGSFDYWAARMAVSQIIFELKTEVHEQVVRDAMRLAGNKLPGESTCSCVQLRVVNLTTETGLWEFVKKGDPPIMGITTVETGVTLADMKRPRVKLPADVTAGRIPATTPGELPAATPTAVASP